MTIKLMGGNTVLLEKEEYSGGVIRPQEQIRKGMLAAGTNPVSRQAQYGAVRSQAPTRNPPVISRSVRREIIISM